MTHASERKAGWWKRKCELDSRTVWFHSLGKTWVRMGTSKALGDRLSGERESRVLMLPSYWGFPGTQTSTSLASASLLGKPVW